MAINMYLKSKEIKSKHQEKCKATTYSASAVIIAVIGLICFKSYHIAVAVMYPAIGGLICGMLYYASGSSGNKETGKLICWILIAGAAISGLATESVVGGIYTLILMTCIAASIESWAKYLVALCTTEELKTQNRNGSYRRDRRKILNKKQKNKYQN